MTDNEEMEEMDHRLSPPGQTQAINSWSRIPGVYIASIAFFSVVSSLAPEGGWPREKIPEHQRLHLSHNGEGASELLVDHQTQDTQHCSPSVVELHAALE